MQRGMTGRLEVTAVGGERVEAFYPCGPDGNGRVGRLLIAFLLQHDGVLRQPLLYLSPYLK